MRAAKFDDVVLRSQQAYLDSAGWVGNSNTMSPRGKEMIISLALLERGSPRLAFGYYVEGRPPLAWPEGAADACVDAKVVAGFLPDSAEFHPERWRILQLRRE
jgi:hypothetical protein